MMNDNQLERYSRHILLKDVGIEGQDRILDSKILVIGAGGLGAPIALYLAAAGVGTIGLIDGDTVDLSNLQRQVIHFTPDIGVAKVESAKAKMLAINPDITVHAIRDRVYAHNIAQYIAPYDFIIDGTDNFPAKFLINDACVLSGKAFSHGGILRFNGQTFTHVPGSACYRCLFPAPPPKNAVPTCSQAGVLGAVAGMLGTIQAAEALKYVSGAGTPLTNRLQTFDALTMQFRTIAVKKQAKCPVCGENPSIIGLQDEEQASCDLAERRRQLALAGGQA